MKSKVLTLTELTKLINQTYSQQNTVQRSQSEIFCAAHLLQVHQQHRSFQILIFQLTLSRGSQKILKNLTLFKEKRLHLPAILQSLLLNLLKLKQKKLILLTKHLISLPRNRSTRRLLRRQRVISTTTIFLTLQKLTTFFVLLLSPLLQTRRRLRLSLIHLTIKIHLIQLNTNI